MAALRRNCQLNVEQLEDRHTPAGSVMTVAGSSFFGSSGAVNLTVVYGSSTSMKWFTAPPTMPAVFASGGNPATANLNINLNGCTKSSSGLVVGNSITINLNNNFVVGNITVNTGPCDDTVTLTGGGGLSGSLIINTLGGNDSVTIGATTVSGNVQINENGGDDFIGFGGAMTVAGQVLLNMGAGNNSYSLAQPLRVFGNFTLAAGAGNDPIGILSSGPSFIVGNAVFVPGSGTNQLQLPCTLSIFGSAAYVGGAGSDDVTDGASIFGNLIALLGAGNDTFSYDCTCPPFVGGSAFIDGGPGIDVFMNCSTNTWPQTVVNFP